MFPCLIHTAADIPVSTTERSLLQTSWRFAIVGVVTALIHYGLLILATQYLLWQSTLASSLGFVVAVSFNYLMHYHWTFASGGAVEPAPHGRALGRYLAMVCVGFLINGGLMHLGAEVLGWHYLLAQALALVAVVTWNFALSNKWVYRA